MGPLVTIMTACYDHEDFLDDYFRGLLTQTYRNLEIIIADDCSPDTSWNVIRRYELELKAAFPRVLCQRNEHNLGPTVTFANLQRQVTGDLVCTLDSDDFYYPTKIEKNVEFLSAHPEMGVVHSGVDMLLPDGATRRRVWEATGGEIAQGWVFEHLLRGNFVSNCSVCIRTAMFKEYVDYEAYAARGYMQDDYAMNLDLAQHAQYGYIEESLACYRIRERSASHFTDPMKEFLFRESAGRIQLDYIQEYGASQETVEVVTKIHYGILYLKGFELGLKEKCLEGYSWLVANGYDVYKRFYHRLRAQAVRNKLTWRLVRTAELIIRKLVRA